MPRKKKNEDVGTVTVVKNEGNVEWGGVLISSSEELRQENEKLKQCIMTLVSYLDAPVKARGKLVDIERLLK